MLGLWKGVVSSLAAFSSFPGCPALVLRGKKSGRSNQGVKEDSSVTAGDLKGVGVTFAKLKAEAQARFQKTARGWDSLAEKLEPDELAQLKAHLTEASQNESSDNFRKISVKEPTERKTIAKAKNKTQAKAKKKDGPGGQANAVSDEIIELSFVGLAGNAIEFKDKDTIETVTKFKAKDTIETVKKQIQKAKDGISLGKIKLLKGGVLLGAQGNQRTLKQEKIVTGDQLTVVLVGECKVKFVGTISPPTRVSFWIKPDNSFAVLNQMWPDGNSDGPDIQEVEPPAGWADDGPWSMDQWSREQAKRLEERGIEVARNSDETPQLEVESDDLPASYKEVKAFVQSEIQRRMDVKVPPSCRFRSERSGDGRLNSDMYQWGVHHHHLGSREVVYKAPVVRLEKITNSKGEVTWANTDEAGPERGDGKLPEWECDSTVHYFAEREWL